MNSALFTKLLSDPCPINREKPEINELTNATQWWCAYLWEQSTRSAMFFRQAFLHTAPRFNFLRDGCMAHGVEVCHMIVRWLLSLSHLFANINWTLEDFSCSVLLPIIRGNSMQKVLDCNFVATHWVAEFKVWWCDTKISRVASGWNHAFLRAYGAVF